MPRSLFTHLDTLDHSRYEWGLGFGRQNKNLTLKGKTEKKRKKLKVVQSALPAQWFWLGHLAAQLLLN